MWLDAFVFRMTTVSGRFCHLFHLFDGPVGPKNSLDPLRAVGISVDY